MMRSRPASASAIPATIVRAVPNLNAGTCAAASQTPANRQRLTSLKASEQHKRRLVKRHRWSDGSRPSMRTLGSEVARGRWGRSSTYGSLRESLAAGDVAVLRCWTDSVPSMAGRRPRLCPLVWSVSGGGTGLCPLVWSVSGGGTGLCPLVWSVSGGGTGLRPLVWSVSGGGTGLHPLVWSVSGGATGLHPLVWSVSGGATGLRPLVEGWSFARPAVPRSCPALLPPDSRI